MLKEKEGEKSRDLITYDFAHPNFGANTGGGRVEVKTEYLIVDDTGNEIPVTGIFGVEDVDCAQGVLIENLIASNENLFTTIRTDDSFKYKIIQDDNHNNLGTHFYSNTDEALENKICSAYILTENKSKFNLVATFDLEGCLLRLGFTNAKAYKNIFTEVVGGTITPQVTGIKNGENGTITYAPNNSSKQYLKSVTVDGVEQSVDLFKNSYIFQNITDDHTIRVEYADLYKVTFDAKGGSPTPETQYVKGGETAVEPVKDPEKKGYTFEGWTLDGGSSPYNCAEPVNKDIKLVAKWKPIVYKIDYVLNGGTNDPDNPTTYTKEDTIDFNPATREGYDFLGWYEDENFTTPIAGVSNRTGDITVYAKWEAKKDVAYKVEHYKETEPGKYELAVTDTLS